MPRHEEVVYVLRAGAAYKVGFSGHMRLRLHQFRTHSPVPVSVVYCAATPQARAFESAMHNWLQCWRLHGEWFRCSREIMDAAFFFGMQHFPSRLIKGDPQ